MNFLKALTDNGYIFPIQAIILLIDGYLISTKNYNGWVYLSSILIISTFVLQAVRRRFFMFHPRNNSVGRESAHIDTWYLRLVIIVATLSALMGWTNTSIGYPLCFNFIRTNIFIIGFIFIVIIPVIFWFLTDRINTWIANKLIRFGPNRNRDRCPACNRFALYTYEVIDKNTVREHVHCNSCQYDDEWQTTTCIGE